MRKLIASLILAVLATIISLGWSISEFAALHNPQTEAPSTTDHLAALKLLGVSLARSLDNDATNNDIFIDNWNQHNSEQLSLVAETEFILPSPLQLQFDSEASLLLESDEGISLHYLLPKTGKVLNINTSLTTPAEASLNLNKLYTMVFYGGVVLIMLVWVSPLIRQLLNLSKTTKAFGMGKLQQRIVVNKTSYIGSIETEFNRMADRIQQLVNDNKLLCRAVSHDLKTPIARLRFGIEALEETHNEKLRVKYFQRLNRDIDTMEELVMTLLSYARLDQANIQPDLQLIELNGWLQQKLANQSGPHQLNFLPSSDPLMVNTDPKYLSMQVANLLSNAERFGHSKVQVVVEVKGDSGWVHFDDDGHGIAAEEAEQVIKPFVRGQQSRGNAGHGMGLAIVTRIGCWMGSKLLIGRAPELGGARMSLQFKRLLRHTS
ncbi:ATP-binding protein [Shewanella colwelliana]|uniref:histidine kinase n=1 Tax=Shewanella colwelliana TaxID=23 RepID=A0A1E5IRY5_SHECO|nr:ATP-binding protein [Shewanella colwelliana]MCZ4337268.1 ATP-binding protein [Shewanella colwelliana]MDX1280084.1 ATP-binding protein [Shewanella colwelliana]OEG73342.1 two-component sensor histidine kinase [Shewanella colwelliana]